MTASASDKSQSLLDGVNEDRPATAAALMVGSLMLLGLQDGIVKLLSDHVSLWQFQILRGGTVLVILATVSVLFTRRGPLPPQRLWAVALRSAFLAGSMVLFFGGAPFLHLSQLAAGLYTFPLFASLLAWLILGEQVGPRRIIAILIGFSGTLMIIKPWQAEFNLFSLMPIAAAVCYACSVIATRRLCRGESPVTLAYAVNITYVLVGIVGLAFVTTSASATVQDKWPYLFGGWFELTKWAMTMIAATAVLNLIANIGLARAYQSAEPSWLAPFDYTYLIFATCWGVILFGHLPDMTAAIGMTLIAASGSFVAWRERQENRRRRANAHRALR